MEYISLPAYLRSLNVKNINPFYSEKKHFPLYNEYDEHSMLQEYSLSTSKNQDSKFTIPFYSRKIFIGGLPPDIYESEIIETFSRFGKVSVNWPNKSTNSCFPPKGYAFLIFEQENSVRKLIQACSHSNKKLYLNVSSQTMKDKPVQIRPWYINDAHYISDKSTVLDSRKTVFIGGLPRTITAYELALALDRLYGNVSYTGIDLDPEFNYPKGAGRVAFETYSSYTAAIHDRFVQLKTEDACKRIEIKPYILDNQKCDECRGQYNNGDNAKLFCANVKCLQYFCGYCWSVIHSHPLFQYHTPYTKELM